MLKRIVLSVALMLALSSNSAFCTVQNDLTDLGLQRNELLKQVATGLTESKISVEDAQKVKEQLDDIVKLESKANEEPLSGPEKVQEITNSLQNIQKNIQNSTHPEKIWLGLSSRDTTLDKKINDALDSKAISKSEAENFKQQLDELHARESNGDPSHGFEFQDAMSLAVDVQTLNNNLDKAISRK